MNICMAGQTTDQFGSRDGATTGGGLRPIGVFWDIENCQVPKGKAATAVVHCIRQHFIDSYTEEEFLCVCDIRKESKEVIQELNLAQVTVVHINATCKNAADDKLKQCMRRFVDTHGPHATLMLISGDVNFSTELSDFRHRRKVQIILIHGPWAPEALTVCAHKCHSYSNLVATVPFRSPTKSHNRFCEVVVNDLPEDKDNSLLHNRLRQLSDNCGGRVLTIVGRTAYLRFPTPDAARRACKRMDGEDVFGSKISVSLHMSRKGTKQSCSEGHSSAGDNTSITQRLPRRSNSCSPDSSSAEDMVSQSFSSASMQPLQSNDGKAEQRNTSSWKWDTSYSAAGESLPGDSPSKNVGRVSPFLLNGKKPPDHEFMEHLPGRMLPLLTRSNVRTLPRRLSTSSSSLCGGGSHTSDRLSLKSPPHERCNTSASSAERLASCTSTSKDMELCVTNIDCRIDVRDLKKLLLAHFQEHVMVLHISLVLQEDGVLHAHVQVPTVNDARVAVSKLNRRLIGRRRINVVIVEDGHARRDVAATSPNQRDQSVLGIQLVQLLKDASHGSLPLFRLQELFENRYNCSISLSEIDKLRDKVSVVDTPSGRMVTLNAKVHSKDSSSSHAVRERDLLPDDPLLCEHHKSPVLGQIDGWARWEKTPELLPKVCISLATLGPRVHALLDRHGGLLPMNSFLACYEAEFGAIPRTSDKEPWRQGCVHLEHLVASLPGVQVDTSSLGVKRITWVENGKESKTESSCVSTGSTTRNNFIGEPLEQLAREAVELLKTQTDSCMALHSFAPTYHKHFNRQCRMADYGFGRLLDLLQALSHVIQILGQGQNRLLTLAHRVQSDRFISDILQVLRMQPNKEVRLTDLQEAYEHCHHHPLIVADYGSCYLEDLFADVSTTLLMVPRGNEMFVTVRHNDDTRKPSLEELERRRQFAHEVVDMLKHSPNCSVLFHKFAPAYHHRFGRQCRTADYGCTKLAELFATIPDIVQVAGEGEDRYVQLCLPQRLQVEQERITATLDASSESCPTEQQLKEAYVAHHDFPLQWEEFGFDSLRSFLQSMGNVVQVEDTGKLHLADNKSFHEEVSHMASLLMDRLDGSMDLEELWQLHHSSYGTYPQMRVVKHLEAGRIARVDRTEGRIVLLPLHLTARDIISLIRQQGGQVPLKNLEELFRKRFHTPIVPSRHKFSSVAAMLNALPEYFALEGPKRKQIVRLRQGFEATTAEAQLGPTQECSRESELLLALRHSPQDLLGSPIPSCVPSPALSPLTTNAPGPGDLMQFEAAYEADSLLDLLDLNPPFPTLNEDITSFHQDSRTISPTSVSDHLESTSSPSRPRKTRLAAKFPIPLTQ
ncbi:meiosis regulator and mRNA stability factor 1-like isoform X2 [Ornithodoros turicata]|uniref:meiosis regulator and mRNA stability factor 1-like isoform X2 n=1 Tax=Ornithodoros turicata TaxID=34597 RepID=UPI0031394C61